MNQHLFCGYAIRLHIISSEVISVHVMLWQVVGITLPVMEQALLQARDGRKHILSKSV